MPYVQDPQQLPGENLLQFASRLRQMAMNIEAQAGGSTIESEIYWLKAHVASMEWELQQHYANTGRLQCDREE